MQPRIPTQEDLDRLKNEERIALTEAKAAMESLQRYLEGMSDQARADMDPDNEEVIGYVENRDLASAARVRYETIRSERASAEPMIRYQAFMERQRDGSEPIGLVEARLHMSKMNYMNAVLGEYEALSVLMVQGPEVLDQYDQAKAAADKWRAEYLAAIKAFESQPDGILNPMSMTPFAPQANVPKEQATIKDYVKEEEE